MSRILVDPKQAAKEYVTKVKEQQQKALPTVTQQLNEAIGRWNANSNKLFEEQKARQKEIDNPLNKMESNAWAYRADASEWDKSVQEKTAEIENDANTIRKLLDEYEGYFDAKWVQNIRKGLKDKSKSILAVGQLAASSKEYSQGLNETKQIYDDLKSNDPEKVEAASKKIVEQNQSEIDKVISDYNLGLKEYTNQHAKDIYEAEDNASFLGQLTDLNIGKKIGEFIADKSGISGNSALKRFGVTEGWSSESKLILYNLLKENKLEEATKFADEYNRQRELNAAAQHAKDNPVLGALESITDNILGGIEWADKALGNVSQKLGYASVGMEAPKMQKVKLTERANALNEGVMDRWDWNVNLGEHELDVADLLYSTIVSGIESAAMSFVPGGYILLGASAASNATNDLIDRGAGDAQAIMGGLVAGVFEALFEKYSIGNLDSLKSVKPKVVKDVLGNVAKSMKVNFQEEFATEFANVVYDLVANGEISNHKLLIKKYLEDNPGASEKDAKKYAAIELGIQIAEAGISGALMGAAFGGTTYFKYAARKSAIKNTFSSNPQLLIKLANSIRNDADVKRLAEIASAELVDNGKVSTKTLNELFTAIESNDFTIIKNAVANRLATLGESEYEEVASAITKKMQGTELSKLEEKILKESKYAEQVQKELDATKENAADWVKNIGTTVVNAGKFNTEETQSEDIKETLIDESAAENILGDIKQPTSPRDLASERTSGLLNKTVGVLNNITAANPKADVMQDAIAKSSGVKRLSDNQKILRKIGQSFGAKVEFADIDYTVTDENGNRKVVSPEGAYDPNTNTITLNTNVKDYHRPVQFILKHELTHSLEKAGKVYEKFMAEVLASDEYETYFKNRGFETADQWYQDIIDRYARDGHPLGSENESATTAAKKEAVADFVGDKLFGGREADMQSLLEAFQPETRKTFIEWVKDVFAKIKQVFKGRTELTEIEALEKRFLEVANKVSEINKTETDGKTEQQKTTSDAASYDDNGNKIPISARFDSSKKDIRYSLPDKNWHTGMTNAEVSRIERLAKHELNSTDNYIDSSNKWLYNDRNGTPYFALYSTEVQENPTVLYASKGDKAAKEKQWFEKYIEIAEAINNGNYDGKTRNISEVLSALGYGDSRSDVFVGYTLERGSDNRNAKSNSRKSKYGPSPALLNCLRNIQETQERRYREYGRGKIKLSLPEHPTPLQIGDAYKNGEITREEYVDRMNELWEETGKAEGTIKQGEIVAPPNKKVPTPKSVSDGTLVRQHARTILESGYATPEMEAYLKELILEGDFSYTPTSNEKTLEKAKKNIESQGYGNAKDNWQKAIAQSNTGADAVATGEALLRIALEHNDAVEVVNIAADLAEFGTRTAQSLQAFSLLKRMGGLGQLVYIQRTVNKLNEDLKKRFKKNTPAVNIDPKLADLLAKAETNGEYDVIYAKIMQDIAAQVPPTFLDKWNAWRYMAMLFNPTTHIKNLVGNGIFLPAVRMKDLVALGMEQFVAEDQRTKVLKVQKQYQRFAEKDFEEVKDIITGSGKYNPSDAVSEYRRIFKNNVLENARKLNFDLLEKEDIIFLKAHYRHALGSFLQAQKVDIDNISTAQLVKAREYAINEALKATYRDASKLANMMSQLSKTNRGANIILEGVLPYKKTPINIMKRGLEYSPIGLVKTLSKGIYDLKTEKITVSQFIDGLAAGTVGTGVFLIGVLLSALGVAKGGFDDDEEWFRKLNGEQEYSIEIGGKSYTIDWAAPSSIPFFMGVAISEYNAEEDADILSMLYDFGMAGFEPIMSLSMLSGIEDVISSVSYAEEGQKLTTLAGSSIKSYFSQALPTIFGKVANVFDDTRRTTYIDKTSNIPEDVQRALDKIASKTPGVSKTRAEYIDAWGETKYTGNFIQRFFQQFVSPGYASTVSITDTSEEISRLYKETGESAVYPSTPEKYIKFRGVRKDLSKEEYYDYATFRGQTQADLVNEAIHSEKYKKLTDEQKVAVIKHLYNYSSALAKCQLDYTYDEIAAMVGEDKDGNAILTKEKYNRLDDKARRLLVYEYFTESGNVVKAYKAEKNGKSVVEYFIKKIQKENK